METAPEKLLRMSLRNFSDVQHTPTIHLKYQLQVTKKWEVRSVHIRSYSGLRSPAFGLNTERYGIFLRIQSEFGKMRTRITPNMEYAVLIKQLSTEISSDTFRKR